MPSSCLSKNIIDYFVRLALREDVGSGDITTNTCIPAQEVTRARILFREEAVVCGLPIVKAVFRAMDPRCRFPLSRREGEKVKAGTVVLEVKGRTRAILTGERAALNFLGALSGIATLTRSYTDAIHPSETAIMDTRKTTPGLRPLERYAVRTGGGVNHRYDLSEMVLIKDNHRQRWPGRLADLVAHVRRITKKKIEIEVDTLEELRDALEGAPEIVLLDNMSPRVMRRAVRIVERYSGKKRPLLEASGGVTLRTVREIAGTGIDRISIGALTHSRRSIDLSLEVA
ncbi:MAG: carboxylating nicotinate-nucleotide diphosphorylase [Elusimicrobia bacterium]|nr:carboxylating nicotinate-nucleotide diphosphorylase [Elusimicrobiota bacterium]